MKLYAYVCEKHGKDSIRMMTDQEFAAMVREHHLDNCQIKGCQFKRDRVAVFEVSSTTESFKATVKSECDRLKPVLDELAKDDGPRAKSIIWLLGDKVHNHPFASNCYEYPSCPSWCRK